MNCNSGYFMSIGKQIRYVRKQRSMDQESFAAQIGIHRVTLSNYERDKDSISLDVIRRIATVTKRPLAWFFLEEGYELVATSSAQTLVPLQRAIEKASGLQDDLLELQEALSK